jgi:hypothetical protein
VKDMPRLWVTVASAALIAGALSLLAAYLDGGTAASSDIVPWRVRLLAPALLVYWLAVPPFVTLQHELAVASVRRVSEDAQEARERNGVASMRWRRLALAAAIGLAVGTLVSQPWSIPAQARWTTLARWGMTVAVWTEIAWFIADTLARADFVAKLQRQALAVDVFDLRPLNSVGRWAMSIVLAIAGAATLAALAISDPDTFGRYWPAIVSIYLTMTVTTGGLFVYATWESHRVIVRLKRSELTAIECQLVKMHSQLRAHLWETNSSELAGPETTSAWIVLERRIREVPDWPFDLALVRNLAASLVLPIAATVIRAYIGGR